MSEPAKPVPIDILPAEVLAQIFELSAIPLSCLFLGQKPQQNPLVVIPSVCTKWRILATSTPSLWTHIDVEQVYDHTNSGRNSLLTRRTVLWLERADDLPIHVHFRASPFYFLTGGDFTPVLKLWAQAASISFTEFCDSYFRSIFDLYRSHGRSERLETLTVDGTGSAPGPPDHFSWLSCVPHSITTLELSNLYRHISPSMDELVNLLSSTFNLRRLKLCRIHTDHIQNVNYPNINLPNLEGIALSGVRLGVVECLLSIITPGTPELAVELELPPETYHTCHSAIQGFFKRSRVASLCFYSTQFNDTALISRHLECVPQLRELIFPCTPGLGYNLLNALSEPVEGEEPNVRCHTLHTLCLVGGLIGPSEQSQLKRVVDSYSLSRIVVDYGAHFVDEKGGNSTGVEIIHWLRERVDNVELHGN